MVSKLTMALFLSGLLAGVLAGAHVSNALEVGDKAPGFTLPGTTGEKISLGQFLGKKYVLVEFYIADFGAT